MADVTTPIIKAVEENLETAVEDFVVALDSYLKDTASDALAAEQMQDSGGIPSGPAVIGSVRAEVENQYRMAVNLLGFIRTESVLKKLNS